MQFLCASGCGVQDNTVSLDGSIPAVVPVCRDELGCAPVPLYLSAGGDADIADNLQVEMRAGRWAWSADIPGD